MDDLGCWRAGLRRSLVVAVRHYCLEIVSATCRVVQVSEPAPVEPVSITAPRRYSYRRLWNVPCLSIELPHCGSLAVPISRPLHRLCAPFSVELRPGATQSERSGERRELSPKHGRRAALARGFDELLLTSCPNHFRNSEWLAVASPERERPAGPPPSLRIGGDYLGCAPICFMSVSESKYWRLDLILFPSKV